MSAGGGNGSHGGGGGNTRRYIVFDGSTDFNLWRARLENELLRFHLLGYIVVKDYDGSQSFVYNNEEIPPKCDLVVVDGDAHDGSEQPVQQQSAATGGSIFIKDEPVQQTSNVTGRKRVRGSSSMRPGRLPRLKVIEERAETMSILQRYLHPEVERAILGKNIYDSWATLCGMYGNRNVSDFYTVHRLLHAMKLGEKDESVQDFIARLELMMEQYSQIAGVQLTDPLRSMMLASALPEDWASLLNVWKAFKPYIPYLQLVEKVTFEFCSRLVLKERERMIAHNAPTMENEKSPKTIAQASTKAPLQEVDSIAANKSDPPVPALAPPKQPSSSSAVCKLAAKAVPEKVKTLSRAEDEPEDKSNSSAKPRADEKKRSEKESSSYRHEQRDDKRDDKYDSAKRDDKYDGSKRANDKEYNKKRDVKHDLKREERREKDHDDRRDFKNQSNNLHSNEKRNVCYYCLKFGHSFRACWFLRVDIENDDTVNTHKKYSATVTNERSAYMVHRIEQYAREVRQDKSRSTDGEMSKPPSRSYADQAAMRSKSSFREEHAFSYSRSNHHHIDGLQDNRGPEPPKIPSQTYISYSETQDPRAVNLSTKAPSRTYSEIASMRSKSMYRDNMPQQQQQQPSYGYVQASENRLESDVDRYKKRSRSVYGDSEIAAKTRSRDPRSRSVFRQPEESHSRSRSTADHGANRRSPPPPLAVTIQRLKDISKEKSAVMWRHNSSASLTTAAAAAAASGGSASGGNDGDGVPPGWTRKESKTQKGRYYYISPAGKTQWTPPVTKATPKKGSPTGTSAAGAAAGPLPLTYNWVTEVEIEFGDGRLGVSLREVRQLDTTPYPQFQAEVDDLPKINGKAGPAELYNWSVKPHKRLTIGMRVTGIEEVGLAGLTYKEVVDKLKKASRPLKIHFADVEKGTVEDNPQLAMLTEQESKESGQSSAYMQQKQEYTRVLVTSELHTELWTIETKKLLRSMNVMRVKWDAVSGEFDLLNERRLDLRKENERLVNEKQKFDTMIKHLKLQEIHAMENPELVKANQLAKRNAELTEDIAKMSAGNKRLRKERVTLQTGLDELESSLAKIDSKASEEDDMKGGDDEFFGIDLTAPPREQLMAFKKKMRFMEEELGKEQRKATKVQREMDQLNKHFANLTTPSSSSSSSRSKTEEREFSGSNKSLSSSGNGQGNAEITRLEAKILELRKQQRSVVETMSKAAQVGDQGLAKECQRRRHAIKEELKHAQDALHKLKSDGSSSSGREGSSGNRQAPSSSSSAQTASSSGGTRGGSSASSSRAKKGASPGSTAPGNSSSSTKGASQRPKKAETMPTLTGFLDKGPTEWSERGLISNMKTMRGARERWCEITPNGFLKYYKRRGDPEVRGEINLADKTLEVVCEDTKRGREFVLSTNSQQSHFFTKSTQELEKWVKTLRAANAYLVTNNQLDALLKKTEAAEKRNGHSSGSRAAQRAAEMEPEEDEQFYGRATLGF